MTQNNVNIRILRTFCISPNIFVCTLRVFCVLFWMLFNFYYRRVIKRIFSAVVLPGAFAELSTVYGNKYCIKIFDVLTLFRLLLSRTLCICCHVKKYAWIFFCGLYKSFGFWAGKLEPFLIAWVECFWPNGRFLKSFKSYLAVKNILNFLKLNLCKLFNNIHLQSFNDFLAFFLCFCFSGKNIYFMIYYDLLYNNIFVSGIIV